MEMERTIVQLNIEHYRAKLLEESDKAKRLVIMKLLAEEEEKWAALANCKQKNLP